MTALSLFLIHFAFAQDKSGLLVKTNYEAKVYFDRRVYQLRDNGKYPDIDPGDGIYSIFITTQTIRPSPLSILKDQKEVFSTTLPPISNTEQYILSALSTGSSLERFEVPSGTNTLDNIRLHRFLLLGIISLIVGILIGFHIRRKKAFFLEMKEQVPSSSPIPSQIISYRNKDDVSKQLLSISRDNFVVFIGVRPLEWNEPMGFGRWLFIEDGTLLDIKRYMRQIRFGESIVFVYTSPESIVEFDCQTSDTQQENINALFKEYPENVLILLDNSSTM